MINARAETVAEKPAYRAAFRRQRCLVVADGFYEWRQAERRKQPYYISHARPSPFRVCGALGPLERSATREHRILRNPDNGRQCGSPPAARSNAGHSAAGGIFALARRERAEPAELTPLLDPFPADEMTAYPVDTAVNSPRRDDPSCIEPLPQRANSSRCFNGLPS